jgi:hypothetical protein
LEEQAVGGALLSVWGSAPDNVFAVGGPLGNGGESLVIRHDGHNLMRLHPGGTETFWWVGGHDASDVWMVGEHGRVVRFDGTTFREQAPGLDVTLWGVWSDAPGSAWIVGGTPGEGALAPNDVVFHFHDGAYERITLPGTPLNVALFKVWGTDASNVYAVGEKGTVWHFHQGSWTLETATPPLTAGTLFTVHGCGPSRMYAVGGQALLRGDGTTWTRETVANLSGANGVNCTGSDVTVVGFGGLKLRNTSGNFEDQSFGEPYQDLHATWSDGAGNTWAVGGDWLTPPRAGVVRTGVLARHGVVPPPVILTP